MKKSTNHFNVFSMLSYRIAFLSLVILFLAYNITAQSPEGTHGKIYCNTTDQILAAMYAAQPGDEIIIAEGTYVAARKTQAPDNRGKWARFVCFGNGTADQPIIVRGASANNRPILQGITGDYNGYTMRIFGDYWMVKDLVITEGSKGIVLDQSNYCQIKNVTVHQIGEEGIHFRDGSSNCLADSCEIFDTGVIQPAYGEGFYVGSDKNQHDLTGTTTDYNPYCFDNTIQNCKIGPNVAAEGADIKEGTKNTVITNCIFSGRGITGENSADAFIDLKGAYAFVYNNTFNVDGSSIIAAGIDVLDRGIDYNTGYRNAIFDNTFNLGSGNDAIPSIRFKQGSPLETHFWDNTRIPDSPEPEGYWTEDIATTCPSWNIVSCNGEPVINRPPSASVSSPNYNQVFQTGSSITITTNVSDSDGEVVKVEFYNDESKLGEVLSSPFSFVLSNVSSGSYSITIKATDNDGAITSSSAIVFKVEDAITTDSPYAFGIIPSNTSIQDAQDAYATFINKFYEDCGNGKGRIRWGLAENSWENYDQSVSEGIAYGMLLAAYFNDQSHFDGLWNYYKAFPNENGFMHWRTEGCSTVLEYNGATDSDVDAAMALIVADKVFGSSGSVNYATEANEMIALIKQYEVESGSFTLKPGDAFGGDAMTNISYFATGAYKLFGQFTNDEAFWNNVVDRCYEIIDNNLRVNSAVGGLVSDWCTADGTQASGKILDYSYDACRTPWRMATDYVWFGDSRAKSYLDKTNDFVQNTIGGIGYVVDGYKQDGTQISTSTRYHSNTFVSTFACAGVALSMQTEFNTYYTEIENTPPVGYFDYIFDLFARSLASGIYTNPLQGGVTLVPVTGISLNQSAIAIEVGGTYALSATVTPADASNKTHTYSSDNTTVATVSNTGVITAQAAGTATVTVTTTDGAKKDYCEVTVNENTGNGGDCNFGTPSSSALMSYNDVSFLNMHVLGTGGPTFTNLSKFRINWISDSKTLKRFAINTEDGFPEYYNDLRSSMTYDFGGSNPYMTISGSGFAGLDGSYWVTNDGDNFVMVSKTEGFTIYFSNSAIAPECSAIASLRSASGIQSDDLPAVSIYPNPIGQGNLTISGLNETNVKVWITDMLGKTMYVSKLSENAQIDVSMLKAGTYILTVKGQNTHITKLFNKL